MNNSARVRVAIDLRTITSPLVERQPEVGRNVGGGRRHYEEGSFGLPGDDFVSLASAHGPELVPLSAVGDDAGDKVHRAIGEHAIDAVQVAAGKLRSS